MRKNPFTMGNANPTGEVDASFAGEAENAFREFVLRSEFPCLGAKAALNSESHTLRVYAQLGGENATNKLSADLYAFTRSIDRDSNLLPHPERMHLSDEGRRVTRRAFESRSALRMREASMKGPSNEYATFVAIFERPRNTTEIEFENLFWKQLRALHDYDARHFAWDAHVSSDPADPHFSFSFGGQSLYVIGLHANSSREARRFPWPALIFNPHEQFERLRADGKWKRMQEAIRSRDLELQGSINPMLSDFGEQSEARQYSGRAVEDDWKAPFPTVEGKCPFGH
ncbi:MAG TPA: guanitoxin biosynthesis heme-dependent pre-guanitoxin N-hydroxylase GntA [Chthoniobacterales bacterium]